VTHTPSRAADVHRNADQQWRHRVRDDIRRRKEQEAAALATMPDARPDVMRDVSLPVRHAARMTHGASGGSYGVDWPAPKAPTPDLAYALERALVARLSRELDTCADLIANAPLHAAELGRQRLLTVVDVCRLAATTVGLPWERVQVLAERMAGCTVDGTRPMVPVARSASHYK
jgi:hypothetical protein